MERILETSLNLKVLKLPLVRLSGRLNTCKDQQEKVFRLYLKNGSMVWEENTPPKCDYIIQSYDTAFFKIRKS